MKTLKYFAAAVAMLSAMMTAGVDARAGADEDLGRAVQLYRSGLYERSMNILQSSALFGQDPLVDGYYALCAARQKTDGYRRLLDGCISKYTGCTLENELRRTRALDSFDAAEYQAALDDFNVLTLKPFTPYQQAEAVFKRGYSNYKIGAISTALNDFSEVDRMSMNDFSAPAQYCSGYIHYCDGEFSDADAWFAKSVVDERFSFISSYYRVICHYEMHDHPYVLDSGVAMYSTENKELTAERKARLARMISESYLVSGDKKQAREYYASSHDDSAAMTRADYFYAGSLMYATKDYAAAVENYSKMENKTDSLGQIALYQTALSYIGLKNKVSALDAFKGASSLDYDLKMKEDAFFNYAKLAFDLNGDTSGFAAYNKNYADSVRGEKIFSYMALASLADRDYQTAIDFYDRLDELQGDDRLNYVHANYLRGAELLDGLSFRKAVQCLKAVTYYTPKEDVVSQLARYNMGRAYYMSSLWAEAEDAFRDLYNSSALYSTPQGQNLPFNVACCLFKQKKYDQAVTWFGISAASEGAPFVKEASLCKADCLYGCKKYLDAAQAYDAFLERFKSADDVYPNYQSAVCYGLAKKPKEKLAVLREACKADPSASYYPESMLELGKTLAASKKTRKEALSIYDKLAAACPSSPCAARALLEAGTIRRNLGSIDAALACYKKVVETMPQSGCVDDALLAIESIYQARHTPKLYLQYLEQIGRGATVEEADKEKMLFTAAEQLFYAADYPGALNSLQEFKETYPQSALVPEADFLIGESYRLTSDREKAVEAYSKCLEAESCKYREEALRRKAEVNFALEDFAEAYLSYFTLSSSSDAAMQSLARLGMMRSAWKAKDYDNAIDAALKVENDKSSSAEVLREARMTRARSLLATSRRDEAFRIFEVLGEDPRSVEGAQSAYLIIQDCFDRGDFASVRSKTVAFSDSGTTEQYWLARAFVVLGDSFAEEGNLAQAKATFESIRDNYSGENSSEIMNLLQPRLDKLNEPVVTE